MHSHVYSSVYTAVMNAFETASWNGGRIRGFVDNALFKILPCNEKQLSSLMQSMFPIDQD